MSRRILEYRETHGPFAAVEELMEVSGIGEAKLAALEGRVTVNRGVRLMKILVVDDEKTW